jgi:hypothetical protein
VHETTSQIFRFAVARDIASRNPAADFKPRDILAEARTENRARFDARELPELLAKMGDYNGDAIIRLAMKLMHPSFDVVANKPHFVHRQALWITQRPVIPP